MNHSHFKPNGLEQIYFILLILIFMTYPRMHLNAYAAAPSSGSSAILLYNEEAELMLTV